MSHATSWIVLQHDLFAVLLDPDTERESLQLTLHAGMLVEDPGEAIERARASGERTIVVRVRGAGAEHRARVGSEDLRGAMPKPRR